MIIIQLILRIKEIFNKYKLILLGLILFTLYFWNRFIRSRTSKLLPLHLNVLGFFILVEVCLIFGYIVISLLFLRKSNPLLEKIIDWVFTPIAELDKYIKSFPMIKSVYDSFLEKHMSTLEYLIVKTNLFYITFWLFPRLILLTALYIDVFIFHQLHYKYQVILFGLLLFFNRCFKYSLKNTKNTWIEYYSPQYIKNVATPYVRGVHPAELEPDYDDDDNYDNTAMTLPLKIFIEFQTDSIVYQGIRRDIVTVDSTPKLREELWEKYIGEKKPDFWVRGKGDVIPPDYKNIFGNNVPDNYYQAESLIFAKCREFTRMSVEKITKLSVLLAHYNKTSNDESFRKIKVLIYANYLICWLYILIISLPTLHIQELLILLNSTWINIGSPF